jgi:hypothetical protein
MTAHLHSHRTHLLWKSFLFACSNLPSLSLQRGLLKAILFLRCILQGICVYFHYLWPISILLLDCACIAWSLSELCTANMATISSLRLWCQVIEFNMIRSLPGRNHLKSGFQQQVGKVFGYSHWISQRSYSTSLFSSRPVYSRSNLPIIWSTNKELSNIALKECNCPLRASCLVTVGTSMR